jgi:hypothetical protein
MEVVLIMIIKKIVFFLVLFKLKLSFDLGIKLKTTSNYLKARFFRT